MKLAALFSGGKDSCFALYKAAQRHKIKCLVTISSKNKESYMFHTLNIEATKMQAKTLGIPQILIETEGRKEKELKELKKALEIAKEKYAIQGVVTGAVRSLYQATRIQKICHKLELFCFNPLWLKDELELIEEILAAKFEVVITGIFAAGLTKELLGKNLKEVLPQLKRAKEKYNISIVGEGGELETFVINCPLFKKKLAIDKFEIIEEGLSAYMKIRKLLELEK